MIHYGDLVEEIHPFLDTPNILVHGTNCLGYMNSGIAKQIRDTYPGVFDVYKDQQKHVGLVLGEISVFNQGTLYVVNANTQQYCRGYVHPYGTMEQYDKVFVDYDAVRECFEYVRGLAKKHGAVVHYPKIGAGLANGDWDIIQEIINDVLHDVDHNLWIKE